MAAGLAPPDFWDAAPCEVAAILKGAARRVARDLRLQQAVAYSQAQLLAVAIHAPKKMPSFAKAFPDPERRAVPQTPAQMLAAMRLWAGGPKQKG